MKKIYFIAALFLLIGFFLINRSIPFCPIASYCGCEKLNENSTNFVIELKSFEFLGDLNDLTKYETCEYTSVDTCEFDFVGIDNEDGLQYLESNCFGAQGSGVYKSKDEDYFLCICQK